MRTSFLQRLGLGITLLACPVAAQQAQSPAPAAARPAPRAAAPAAQRPALLGDESDGSRARPVHVIPLRDEEGEVVRPTDLPLLPFSPRQTCAADCHDAAKVGTGLHFNVMAPSPAGARPGEPWLLVEPETATQLPLSYHRWPGTWAPWRLGITPWQFAKLFAARTPGGFSGAREPSAALKTRWAVSGELDINCLACHDASPAYNHPEYGRQIALENFRWAGTAASGIGVVTGAAREMPNTFDPLLPFVEDSLRERIPSVDYVPGRFLPDSKVVFDVVREVPARRCYFCHTNADTTRIGQERWRADQDVHLQRGMTCVDCHRNGLDHAMTRGYAAGSGGTGASASAEDVSVSCRGCHLATEPDRVFARGRMGAPYPKHEGLPPIHFTKLSCTACHSGPAPEANVRQLKTSQAHRLGGLAVNKAPEVLPHLYYPVFARTADGTTTANRAVWPAFWGREVGGQVTPLLPEHVKRAMTRAHVTLKAPADGGWPALDEALVARVLASLADGRGAGTPVYVAGGRVHSLKAGGGLTSEENAAAQPYLWPIAHDVRPASQALGAKGCQDCHDAASPVFFGKVSVDSPIAADRTQPWAMARFQKGLDTKYAADFANTFQYRPWLKATVTASAIALLLFVLAYLLPALSRLSTVAGAQKWKGAVVNLAGLVAGGVTLTSGYPALVSGGSLTGYRLMLHVGSAPVFTAAGVVVTLFWAARNGFGTPDWNRLRHPFGPAARHAATPYLALLRKAAFWVAVAAAIPAIVSVTLAMFPVTASIHQTALILAHRYAAWTLAVSGVLFLVLAVLAWIQDLWVRRAKARLAPVAAGN
jgi:hypothetical protein